MRRKYGGCQRQDGNCAQCSLVSYGRDCHNKPINNLAWYRMAAELTQQQLADASGVNIRQIQRIENGEGKASNMSAGNLIAIAKVLAVDAEKLL